MPLDRMDPVRRSFRVSSRHLPESRNRSMSMRMPRGRQQHYLANRSPATSRKQTEYNTTAALPSRDTAVQKPPQPAVKPRACIKQPSQDTPRQPSPKEQLSPKHVQQPVINTPPNNGIPMSRTSSACSSVSSVSVPGFGGRVQKYSLQRQRHYTSQTTVLSSGSGSPQLTGYSRRSEGMPISHHVSVMSLANNNRSVHFEDEEDRHSSLSQSCDNTDNRKFVPLNQRWQENSTYSPRRSRANSQSPARVLERDLSLRTQRTRSQSPGRTLDESPHWSHSRSRSPGNYLDTSLSQLPTDTDYYADSDIASQRSVTPESILESDATPFVRSTDKKFVIGIQRSYSALKNRGGSTITTTTSSFANPRKNIRRSIPRSRQHKVSDAISEVGSNSFCASQETSMSFSQSQDTRGYSQSQDIRSFSQSQDCRTMTPLDVTDRLTAPVVDTRHSKTESDVGYMSAGADELDTDMKSSSEMKSNRESGYLSCCDSVLIEQNMISKVGVYDCNVNTLKSLVTHVYVQVRCNRVAISITVFVLFPYSRLHIKE